MILKKETIIHILLYVLFFLVPLFSYGQTSDTFTIRTLVGDDLQAPTIPTNVTATPIAMDQIDLDWDASSDNVSVAGYQVFRDAVQIATTTLTSYSDVGLSSSTLYAYYLTAFDDALNYSSSSVVVATTTLSPPPGIPEIEDNTGYRIQEIEMYNFAYSATQNSIDISFGTNVQTRTVIRWGRTSNFESGSIASGMYKRDYRTTIDELEPGTIYEIEIYLVDRSHRNEFRYTILIETEAGPDIESPPNVLDLDAYLLGSGAELTWQNPLVADFSHVRVLSSDYFYPTHIADGWLVYEGGGESAFDGREILDGGRRYYTVFAYDVSGNISSGAVTTVSRGTYRKPPDRDPSKNGATSSFDTISTFSFDDLVFTQDDEVHPSFGNMVTLDGEKNTIISIPYELLPEYLKTIVITLQHPVNKNKTFSFLLRIDPQKTTYEARVGPLHEAGQYATNVEVFDFKTQELHTVDGTIVVEKLELAVFADAGASLISLPLLKKFGLFFSILLITLLLAYRFIVRRSSEDSTL
ncbi:fibronectin type III domain-containing protein [Candidatus Pacebacteria bacterium]|nr:fibronectin type III domain-containing protein [Candidatus Paceibacterota bacterium]